jgi:hypothetical protein
MITIHLRISRKTLVGLKEMAKEAHLPLRVYVMYLLEKIALEVANAGR